MPEADADLLTAAAVALNRDAPMLRELYRNGLEMDERHAPELLPNQDFEFRAYPVVFR